MLSVDVNLPRKCFDIRVTARFDRVTSAVIGPSGAGKTSLLRCIAGLEKNARGTILLNGEPLLQTGSRIDVPAHKRRVGLCFQNDRLFPHYSVEQNLRYGEAHGRREAPLTDFDEVVDRLQLRPLLRRRVYGISGGEARCVALGRTLLGSPRVLLLDEPFTGLDGERRRDSLSFLRDIEARADIPILVVSHDMESVLTLTNNLAIIGAGTLLGHGTLSGLIHDSTIANLLHGTGLVNVLRLRVSQNDARRGVTLCQTTLAAGETTMVTGEGRLPLLKTRLLGQPTGTEIAVSLRPEDIVLARRPVPDFSIQNQLNGRVLSITPCAARSLCLIDAGPKILADVPSSVVDDLALRKGAALWCLFKAEHLRSA